METLLLTDDNASCGDVFKWLLQDQGYQVIYEPRKDRSLELIATLHPHLVITDLSPAPIDGFELIHSVAARAPKLPIVVVSGMMDKEIDQKARRLGASACFAKPFDILAFLTGIEQVLHPHQFHCAA